jgi:hypothetical protein
VPQRDTIHDIVKQALINDGWEITDDPFVIPYGKRFLYVDLGATGANTPDQIEEKIIGAKCGDRQIAVEIKDFRRRSEIADLEQALGQYVLYGLLLNRIAPEREMYLAIAEEVYRTLFSEPIGEVVITDLPLQLIVVNLENEEVQQWIPSNPIVTS